LSLKGDKTLAVTAHVRERERERERDSVCVCVSVSEGALRVDVI